MARPESTKAAKRPATKTATKARRGRPPKSATAAKKTGRRKIVVKRAAKAPTMTARIRELKQEARTNTKALKMEVAALKKELSAARRNEAKLVKLFDAKDKAVAAFGAKWQAKAFKTSTKRKPRRRKGA